MAEPQTPVSCEVFEEEPPSYFPSYVMSGFVLAGLASIAYHRLPLWPLSLAHPFLAAWFGVLFYWMLLNAAERRRFSSQRLTVAKGTYRHSFRYAVTEATHVEIPLAEIEEVRVSSEEPCHIEVVGKSDSDIYFLPRTADVDRLIAAMLESNPAIRVIR